MRFVSLFAGLHHDELYKDPGQIPNFIGDKNGWTAHLVSFKDPHVIREVSHYEFSFSLDNLPAILKSEFISYLVYIMANAKQIDVLMMFHLRLTTILPLFLYKVIHPSGFAYLKLDGDERLFSNRILSIYKSESGLKGKLLRLVMNRIDLFSIENSEMLEKLKKDTNLPLMYIPNGVIASNEYVGKVQRTKNFVHVARMGTYQKNTELLLSAWQLATKIDKRFDASLTLIGDATDNIFSEYEELFDPNGSVEYLGKLPPEEVQKRLAENSFFVLTSRFESFGLVYIEALSAGNIVISTPISVANDIFGRRGLGHFASTTSELAQLFVHVYNDLSSDQIIAEGELGRQLVKDVFTWDIITDDLIHLFERRE